MLHPDKIIYDTIYEGGSSFIVLDKKEIDWQMKNSCGTTIKFSPSYQIVRFSNLVIL
jgi:hypothetical protein